MNNKWTYEGGINIIHNYRLLEKGDNFAIIELDKFSVMEWIRLSLDGLDIGSCQKGIYQGPIHVIPVDEKAKSVKIKIELLEVVFDENEGGKINGDEG